LPSGSEKKQKRPEGKVCTSDTLTPRSRKKECAAVASFTLSWTPSGAGVGVDVAGGEGDGASDLLSRAVAVDIGPDPDDGARATLTTKPGPAMGQVRGRVMDALVNGLLWLGMFAIPMLIAVILRRLGRKYGLDDRYAAGDPAQEPDYRRWG
jgi:hypothetical protein